MFRITNALSHPNLFLINLKLCYKSFEFCQFILEVFRPFINRPWANCFLCVLGHTRWPVGGWVPWDKTGWKMLRTTEGHALRLLEHWLIAPRRPKRIQLPTRDPAWWPPRHSSHAPGFILEDACSPVPALLGSWEPMHVLMGAVIM